ncbi:MAG: mechanosensitive ion channel family protein [Aquificaceae bacterium]|nr:mechanosensitive ion channel family protein [Aquificaceae bacterium]MDW8237056.1 mechanosensitive ion channel [Aquificaceae bacterium]
MISENILWAGLITLLSLLIARFVGDRLKSSNVPIVIIQSAKGLIIILGVLASLEKLGIAITPMLTALGVGGLAVALALRDSLENLFAGFYILATRQIRQGDYIKLQSGEEGKVQDISWRNTTLLQANNNLIIVPNSKITTSIITNYSLPQEEINLSLSLNLVANENFSQIEEIILKVATNIQENSPNAAPNFVPRVRFVSFRENTLELNVIVRSKGFENIPALRHELLSTILSELSSAGLIKQKTTYPDNA